MLKDLYESEETGLRNRVLRYVIYARKSTDDPKKQQRSLPDQIQECRDVEERYGLKVVKVIRESRSAKEPDIRPDFREMINGLKAGAYDGVIAWHPDRLARNMKEAGEIIDLLDKHVIRDLRFASFTFENTPSGKMTLGITFVLSKEYSDQLSENVGRGNRHKLSEGRYINRTKHGYYKDANSYMRPDGENYALIRNAFRMRLRGRKLEEIASYLNQSGYTIQTKVKDRSGEHYAHRIFRMDKKRVSKFLTDPVYVGVLRYGKIVIDLVQQYDFKPMITANEFMQINKTDGEAMLKLARRYRDAQEKVAGLMSGMVLCEECGEPTTPGITPKKTKDGTTRYFYYRCDTEDCERRGKSTRAKVIMDYACGFLDAKPFSSKASYARYQEEMKRVSEERTTRERGLLVSLQAQLRKQEQKIVGIKETMYGDFDASIKQMAKEDLKKAEDEKREMEHAIEQKKKLVEQGKTSLLTYQQFIELMDNMGKNLRSLRNLKDIDFVMRKIFLNFTVSGKNIANATLSAPFEELYKLNVSKGGRKRTRTSIPCGTSS